MPSRLILNCVSYKGFSARKNSPKPPKIPPSQNQPDSPKRPTMENTIPPEHMNFYVGSAAIADNGDLLAFGEGLMRMSFEEASWQRILPAQYKVDAVGEPFLIAEVDGRVQLLRLTQQGVSVIGEFPEDRYPMRIVANEETIRVLTRLRDPSAAGLFFGGLGRALFRSEDGGSSWKATRLGAVQIADIAGERAGIGITIRNRVFLSK